MMISMRMSMMIKMIKIEAERIKMTMTIMSMKIQKNNS